MPTVPLKEDKDSVRHFQDVELFRNHKAPFVPFADIPVDGLTDEQKDELEEDRQQFAVPFEMMSAVWIEMADEFVTGCRTLEAAEVAFGELKDSGRTLEEIQTDFHRIEPRHPGWREHQMFVEPTHEELAMNFVINCGGVELAEACLAEWKAQ